MTFSFAAASVPEDFLGVYVVTDLPIWLECVLIPRRPDQFATVDRIAAYNSLIGREAHDAPFGPMQPHPGDRTHTHYPAF